MRTLDDTMDALVWLGPRDMVQRSEPMPRLADGDVLVAVGAVGICGSELSGFLGQNSLRVPPLIMGHECAGRIVEATTGTFATGQSATVGTRVTFNPLVVCGTCDRCRAGRTNLCRRRQLVGAHRPGAFAQYVAVPATQCYPLPDHLSLVAGSLAEPLACSIHAVVLAGVQPNQSLLVLGVDFRNAPDVPGSMLAEDNFAALTWLIAHAEELGVDPARIALMGESGGGGIAAGTTILARDRGVKNVEDIIQTVALCRRYHAPLLPRGGGTSLAGQTCNTAVVLDMSKYMHTILDINPEQKIARIQPGLVLDALRRASERSHLTFGPDPATHAQCTLGGMIGNNSCGTHSVMAGMTSDNIEALDILTYDGLRMRVGQTSDEELAQIISEGGRRGDIYARLKALRLLGALLWIWGRKKRGEHPRENSNHKPV